MDVFLCRNYIIIRDCLASLAINKKAVTRSHHKYFRLFQVNFNMSNSRAHDLSLWQSFRRLIDQEFEDHELRRNDLRRHPISQLRGNSQGRNLHRNQGRGGSRGSGARHRHPGTVLRPELGESIQRDVFRTSVHRGRSVNQLLPSMMSLVSKVHVCVISNVYCNNFFF